MTNDELKSVLEEHKLWLETKDTDKPSGTRADLRGADLSDADLSDAYLSGAYLHDADLRGADLSDADLHGADLHDSYLSGAYLSGADLHCADLHGADLSGADLHCADLHGADLHDADLRGADLHGANLDYSSWPLWCGSLDVKIDSRIAAQLVYHAVRACQSVTDDADVAAYCNDPVVIKLANRFHRADECGRIAAVGENEKKGE